MYDGDDDEDDQDDSDDNVDYDDDDDKDDDDDDQDDDADLNRVLLVAEGLLHHRPNLCVTQFQPFCDTISTFVRHNFKTNSLRWRDPSL